MTQFAAVISDLDGVLVDSMAATARAWAAWGDRHGLDGVAIQAANHGKPAGEVVAAFVPPERLAEEAAILERLEVEDTEGVVALPGAAGVLALPVVAIATSCVHRWPARGSARPGWSRPRCSSRRTRSRTGSRRPTPTCSAAERLGLDPAGCLVLEDAPAGVAAGRAAGMTVWAVTTTHAPEDLTAADRVAAGGLPEVLEWLAAPTRRAA